MIEPTRIEPTPIDSIPIESTPNEPTQGSMSIRDRLTRFGLFPQFEAAVLSQDPVAVVEVLLRARMTLIDADLTAHAMCRHTPRDGMLIS